MQLIVHTDGCPALRGNGVHYNGPLTRCKEVLHLHLRRLFCIGVFQGQKFLEIPTDIPLGKVPGRTGRRRTSRSSQAEGNQALRQV